MALRPWVHLLQWLGLTASLCVFLLVAALLAERYLPDPSIQAPHRIVMIDFKGQMPGRQEDWFGGTPLALSPALAGTTGLAQAHGRRVSRRLPAWDPTHALRKDIRVAMWDASLVPMMGLRALQGDLQACLARPGCVAVHVDELREWPGGLRMGQRLHIRDMPVEIGSVFEGLGSRHPLQDKYIVGWTAPVAQAVGLADADQQWFQVNGQVYAQLAEGASAAELGAWAERTVLSSAFVATLPAAWRENGRKAALLRAVPLTELPRSGPQGHRQHLTLVSLLVLASLMLVMAVVNLASIRATEAQSRSREWAIRKSLGASAWGLTGVMAGELLVIVLPSLILAWMAARATAKAWAPLLQLPAPSLLTDPVMLPCLVIGGLVLVLLSAGPPAWIASRQAPAPVLQGRQASERATGSWLRRLAMGLQYTLGLAMAGLGLVMQAQLAHVLERPREMDLGGIHVMPLPPLVLDAPAVSDLQRALREQAGVAASGLASGLPGDLGSTTAMPLIGDQEGRYLSLRHVDNETLQVFAWRPRAGRPPAGEIGSVWLDEETAQRLASSGQQLVAGQALVAPGSTRRDQEDPQAPLLRHDGRFAAILPSLNVHSTRQRRDMEGYVVTQASAMRAAAADGLWLSLRCEPDSCANVRQVTERWWQGRGLPRHLAPPLHDWATLVMADYRSDLLATRATLAGAMLTLLLTAMGSMMLAAHTLQRKRRELVLRKLHGAPAWRMAWPMARELGAVLAGSAVLAGIWQWWAGRLYLSQFVDAVPLTPWPWLVATAGLGLLMVASVSRQLMEAWRIQPIEALRD